MGKVDGACRVIVGNDHCIIVVRQIDNDVGRSSEIDDGMNMIGGRRNGK